jgi:hypothetical protein
MLDLIIFNRLKYYKEVVMKKISMNITDELDEKLITFSKKMGVSKSYLIIASVNAGLGGIIRATFPEESMSPAQWAKIITDMMKTGVPIVLPDGSIVGSEDKDEKNISNEKAD